MANNLVLTFVLMFLLTALPGRWSIAWLRKLGAKQNINPDAPSSHAVKQGTPTMGGLMFLIPFFAVILAVALYNRNQLEYRPLLPLLLLTFGYFLIGFLDDLLSAKRGKNLGLTPKQKLFGQFLFAILFVVWLGYQGSPITTQVQMLPSAILAGIVDFGWLYYGLGVLFIVGFSNATNITDGLDGLAGGLTLLFCLGMTLLFATSTMPNLTLFTVAMAGGLAGFLWWNAHPARVFMGDTASLPLGAALAGASMIGKQEIGLIVMSLVCWAELISVMIQVSVFKWRKKKHGIEYARANRVFRRTPLHHHFEELGIRETAIVQRFWIVGAVSVALALLWGRL